MVPKVTVAADGPTPIVVGEPPHWTKEAPRHWASRPAELLRSFNFYQGLAVALAVTLVWVWRLMRGRSGERL
jgi:hypothetical protein